MTERLYYKDGGMSEFYAVVMSCKKEKNGRYAVILDRTAFFPGGGGQECDTGELGYARVLEVSERDGEIVHYTDSEVPDDLVVKGKIDWEKRYRRMQNHTGEHIVSGLIYKKFGYSNVGFHMGSEDVTADFDGVLTEDELREIEYEANLIIYKNLRVYAEFPDADELSSMQYRCKKELTGDVRIVTIEGCDRCACCAPHVSSTGEIGMIRLLGFMHYKGGVRIHMLCGLDALCDYRNKSALIKHLCGKLSSKPEKLKEKIERLSSETAESKKVAAEAENALIDCKLSSLEITDGNRLFVEPGMNMQGLARLASGASEKVYGISIAVSGSDESGYRYVAASKHRNLLPIAQAIGEVLDGKGGGSDKLIQGSINAKIKDIESFFESLGEN